MPVVEDCIFCSLGRVCSALNQQGSSKTIPGEQVLLLHMMSSCGYLPYKAFVKFFGIFPKRFLLIFSTLLMLSYTYKLQCVPIIG